MGHIRRVFILLGALLVSSQIWADDNSAAWGYIGEQGPEHWGSLHPDFATCDSGLHQSPIDLAAPTESDLSRIKFSYQPGGYQVVNNRHTMVISYHPGSYFTLDKQRYDLQQIHFHAPSEHRVDGVSFDMEAHLVHSDAEGKLAVIAVLFEVGNTNMPLIDTFWHQLPREFNQPMSLTNLFSAKSLLPKDKEYFRYDGSLTTPPCTEGVLWLVMVEPAQASMQQVRRFSSLTGVDNNRPLQPLNSRMIAIYD